MRNKKIVCMLPVLAYLLCGCSAYKGETHVAYTSCSLAYTLSSIPELYADSDFAALLRVNDAQPEYDAFLGAMTNFTADILALYKGEQGDRTLRAYGGVLGLDAYLDGLEAEDGIDRKGDYTQEQLDKDTVLCEVERAPILTPGQTILYFARYVDDEEDGACIMPFFVDISVYIVEGDTLSFPSVSDTYPMAEYLVGECGGTVTEDEPRFGYTGGYTATCPFSAVEPLLTES